jgi:hypothetical protein
MQFMRESYLTVFVAFFRFCQRNWSSESNMYKGAFGMTLFHVCLLLGLAFWATYFGGARLPDIPRLTGYAVFFLFSAVHCYVLIRRGYGIRFEQTFRTFDRRRRIWLLTTAWLLMAASWGFAFGSAYYLRPYLSVHP